MVARRRREAMVTSKIIKPWILYLKQQSSILWCFCRLKFWKKSLFTNMFFSFTFRSKMIVHAAEKNQVKYFAQNLLGKISLFYVQTAAWLSCCCHKLLFHHSGTVGSSNSLQYERPPHQRQNTSSKHKKTKTI